MYLLYFQSNVWQQEHQKFVSRVECVAISPDGNRIAVGLKVGSSETVAYYKDRNKCHYFEDGGNEKLRSKVYKLFRSHDYIVPVCPDLMINALELKTANLITLIEFTKNNS